MGVLWRSAVVAGSAGPAVALVPAATLSEVPGDAARGAAPGIAAEAVHTTAAILRVVLPAFAPLPSPGPPAARSSG